MSLSDWGEIPHRNLELAEGEALARIIEEQKTSFQVATEKGFLKAQVAGKLLRPSVDRLLRPVVGDWVKIRALWQEKKAVIQEVLPRSSLLRRKAAGESEAVQPLAANVSLTLIVTTLNREFNEKRLHRYLTAAEESGSRVAVLFTKSDLIPESFACAEELSGKYRIPCLALSAVNGEGMEALRELWGKGETAVFVGSSGVGKSTLINALLGREEQVTGRIRDEDDRGRHTTTYRRLLLLPNGAMVIDTPGLREIQLESGQVKSVALAFPAIEELALQCRFRNCKHDTEPNCAVKSALQAGSISESDFESFQKLKKSGDNPPKPKKHFRKIRER